MALISLFSLLFLAFPVQAKKAVPVVVPVGWYTEAATKKTAGWRGSCYLPPEWDKLSELERRMAREAALQAMTAQWLGQKDAIVSFSPEAVESLQDVLLSRPEQTEQVALRNATFCKDVMVSGASTDAWGAWVGGLANQLNQGLCLTPFDYQFVQYLRVDTGWQEQVPLCQGDRIAISVGLIDKFRVSRDGDWIDATGDPAQPATSEAFPCNMPGCLKGQFVGRFVTNSGVETIFAIGASKVFEAPADGYFSYTINDDSYDDNAWRSQGSIVDQAAVTLSPAD